MTGTAQIVANILTFISGNTEKHLRKAIRKIIMSEMNEQEQKQSKISKIHSEMHCPSCGELNTRDELINLGHWLDLMDTIIFRCKKCNGNYEIQEHEEPHEVEELVTTKLNSNSKNEEKMTEDIINDISEDSIA